MQWVDVIKMVNEPPAVEELRVLYKCVVATISNKEESELEVNKMVQFVMYVFNELPLRRFEILSNLQ